jgi:predicted metal-dependent peptidase
MLDVSVDDLRELGTEGIYRLLRDKAKNNRRFAKWLDQLCNNGNAQDLIEGGKYGDGKEDETNRNSPFDNTQHFADQHHVFQKLRGLNPGNAYGEYQITMQAKLDLRKHLRKLNKTYRKGFDDVSFFRQSKLNHALDLDVVLPGHVSYTSSVIVSIDTSGSISDEEFRDFINIILYNADHMECDIVMCDADIQAVFKKPPFATSDDVDQLKHRIKEFLRKRKGYGGTSITPIIKWIKDQRKHYDAWIHFTDLYIDASEYTRPRNVKQIIFAAEYNNANRNIHIPGVKILYF